MMDEAVRLLVFCCMFFAVFAGTAILQRRVRTSPLLAELRARVEVLERIVTSSGYQLDEQIRRLD